MIRQGEVYYAELFEAGRRPVLVVSADRLNRGRYVVVVAFTSRRLEERRGLSTCVPLSAGEFGLANDCVAQCDTIASVPIELLDDEPVGRVDAAVLRTVVRAVGEVIATECEPSP